MRYQVFGWFKWSFNETSSTNNQNCRINFIVLKMYKCRSLNYSRNKMEAAFIINVGISVLELRQKMVHFEKKRNWKLNIRFKSMPSKRLIPISMWPKNLPTIQTHFLINAHFIWRFSTLYQLNYKICWYRYEINFSPFRRFTKQPPYWKLVELKILIQISAQVSRYLYLLVF